MLRTGSLLSLLILNTLCFSTLTLSAQETSEPQDTSTASPTDKEATDDSDEKQPDEEPSAKPTKVQIVPLSGNYVDHPQPMSLDPTALLLGGAVKQKSFFRMCEYLERLEKNKELGGVLFDLSNAISLNAAQLDELARRCERLRKADKKLVAWLTDASTAQISLAAACDVVLMADFGGVDLPSATMESMFYRDAMDLVGIQASIVRAGDFKGAVEPYTNPEMSVHLRNHSLKMLQSLNDATVNRIAAAREVTAEEIRNCQKKRILTPEEAVSAGLVDHLAPLGSMRTAAAEHFGEQVEWLTLKSKPQQSMSFFELMGRMMAQDASASRTSGNTIVVLHLSGTIVTGKSEVSGSIVSQPTVNLIDRLLKDDNVKGVVVRINSPGGSATASEIIRVKLAELAAAKPTIISMGEMAASGGYWVSCIDAPVYAESGTITGSIGVFSMKLSAGALLRRVGVNIETLALDDSAKMNALDKRWSPTQQKQLQGMVDQIYSRFLKLVASHRDLTKDQVAELAGGRVWSGAQAHSLGLVDNLGGVDTCLQKLQKKLKLKTIKVVHRPESRSGLDLSDLLGNQGEEEIMSSVLNVSSAKALRARGFSLDSTLTLIRESLKPKHPRANVWLLHPAEFVIQ